MEGIKTKNIALTLSAVIILTAILYGVFLFIGNIVYFAITALSVIGILTLIGFAFKIAIFVEIKKFSTKFKTEFMPNLFGWVKKKFST